MKTRQHHFYTREDWGARAPEPGPGFLRPELVRGIALHWPAMSKPLTSVRSVMAALRSWQAYHMDQNGWSDIAYQIAIDQQGNRYRLRGLKRQSAANGDVSVNEKYGAILLVVAPGEQLTDNLIFATRRAIADHRDHFPQSHMIVGHRDIRPAPTECPGPIVYGHIQRGTFNPNRSK